VFCHIVKEKKSKKTKFKQVVVTTSLISIEGKKKIMSNLPWAVNNPTVEHLKENCVLALQWSLRFHSRRCENTYCSLCNFKEDSVFRLKGFCSEQSLIDTHYTFVNENGVAFRGLYGKTFMAVNETSQKWQLTEYVTYAEIASFNNSKVFPIGLHEWSVNFDCDKKLDKVKTVGLKLTKVSI
jgi:hypothetical protein